MVENYNCVISLFLSVSLLKCDTELKHLQNSMCIDFEHRFLFFYLSNINSKLQKH